MRVGRQTATVRSSRPAGRVVVALLCLGVAAVLVSACQITSGTQFVSHRAPDGVDVFFRVPPHWAIFDTNQIIEAQNGRLGPTQLKQIGSGQWIESMTPRPGATAKNSLGIGKRFPTALVEARVLGTTERDDLSFSTMRSELLGTDPLTATSGFQVLSYTEFADPGGIHGIKMIVNITNSTPVLTFGQVTAVDANTNYIFAVGVGCEASCWGENAGAVTSLLNSWTLKEQSP